MDAVTITSNPTIQQGGMGLTIYRQVVRKLLPAMLLILVVLCQQVKPVQAQDYHCANVHLIALRSELNGKIVRAGITASTYLGAASPHILGWEMFRLIHYDGAKVALQSDLSQRFVHAKSGSAGRLAAVSERVTDTELFTLIDLGNGKIALRSELNSLYVRADNSPDGYLSATSGAIGTAERFELIPLETDKILTYPLRGYESVGNVSMSPSGNYFITSGNNGSLILWNANTCKIEQELPIQPRPARAAFNNAGTQISFSDQNFNLILWDIATRASSQPLIGHANSIYGLAFSPDDAYLVSSSSDQKMYRWDVGNLSAPPGEFVGGHATGVASLAIHPDPASHLVASGGNDGNSVLWQLDTLQSIATLTGHTDAIYGIAFSPDGKLLATGSWDTTIKLWDVASQQLIRTLTGHTGHVRSVQFSANGKMLVSAGADSTVRLWEVATGAPLGPNLLEHPDSVVDAAVFTPDDQGVISADRKNNLFFWDISAYALKPVLNFSSATYTAAENSTQLILPVTLDVKAPRPVTINYTFLDDSAKRGNEYQVVDEALTIPTGEQSGSIAVTIIDDCGASGDPNDTTCFREPDKRFFVEISSDDDVTLGEVRRAAVTILDDDHVIVRNEHGQPVANAQVALYRNNELFTSTVTVANGDALFESFQLDDRLLALEQQEPTNPSLEGLPLRAYITSMDILSDPQIPADQVARLQPITTPGEQIVTVKKSNTLILFDLIVSLEWETVAQDTFIEDLEAAFNSGSAHLYDVTDGQFAFGNIKIYDGGEQWNEADLQILASNQVRPHAIPCSMGAGSGPSFFRMGRSWNRYGDIDSKEKGALSLRKPDGFRTLVHEFLHYAFCLHDQYFMIDETNTLISAFCVQNLRDQASGQAEDAAAASIMYWPYATSELDMQGSLAWHEKCKATQQWQETGESSWETVKRRFRDDQWDIKTPPPGGSPNAGPAHLPFADWLTTFEYFVGEQRLAASTPKSRQFRVLYPSGRLPYSGDVDIYLQSRGAANEVITIDQGSTDGRNGLIDILGIQDTDTVLAISWDGRRFATKNVDPDNNHIKLSDTDWNPVITARPLIDPTGTPTGVRVNVLQVAPLTGMLRATLVPLGGKAVDEITLSPNPDGSYSGIFHFPTSRWIEEAHLWIREEEPATGKVLRQTITTYSIGGSPGSHERSYVPSTSDGSCSLFFNQASLPQAILDQAEVIVLPSRNIPTGLTYRRIISPPCYFGVPQEVSDFVASGQTDFSSTLVIYYNRTNMQGVDPDLLRIYHWIEDGTDAGWVPLDSTRDEQNQLTSAKIKEFGLYVLVEEDQSTQFVLATADDSGEEVSNILPIRQETAVPIVDALAVCLDSLNAVYTPDENGSDANMKKYVAGAPDYVNSLQFYQPHQTYYAIMVEDCVFTHHPAPSAVVASASQAPSSIVPASQLPRRFFPAGYYGVVQRNGLNVAEGTQISAQINGVTYAEARSMIVNGHSVYTLDIPADDPETATIEGGQAGQSVTLLIDGVAAQAMPIWQAGVTTVTELTVETAVNTLFLPIVAR
mgnify:CR=1 FL=1